MTDPVGEHDVIPPDEGDPVPRLDLEPEGDAEDGIEPIAAESDDEWGQDDSDIADPEG